MANIGEAFTGEFKEPDSEILPNDLELSDVRETDNEALSSLLMLSKSNADAGVKGSETEVIAQETQNRPAAPQFKPATATMNVNVNAVNMNNLGLAMKRPPLVNDKALRVEPQPLSKTVKIEDLRRYFHLPIVEVARQLGTCTTALKKICRKNKISKWPYRQIRSITKSIQSLEMASLNDTLSEELRIQYREQIVTLQNAIDELIKDPNKVVTLVNMGLSEDGNMNLDSPNSSSPTTTPAPMATSGNLGFRAATHAVEKPSALLTTGGVLSMMPWPKPSPDVQQIMQAASALTSESLGGKNRGGKRKLSGGDGKISAEMLSMGDMLNGGGSGLHGSGGSSNSIPGMTAELLNSMKDYSLSDDEGSSAVRINKVISIGLTSVSFEPTTDASRFQFIAPVQLAPLQRKKLRPNISRKVVPLMEPDIGSNFGIEFVPQFILDILRSKQTNSTSLADLEARLVEQHMLQQAANGGHQMQSGQFVQHAASTQQQQQLQQQQTSSSASTAGNYHSNGGGSSGGMAEAMGGAGSGCSGSSHT